MTRFKGELSAHSPSLFLALNISSGAAKFWLSLPSPSVLADSPGPAG